MLRTILFYPGIILGLIISPLSLIKIKYLERKGKLEERTAAIHKTTSLWAKFVMKLSGAKVTVTGSRNIPEDEAVLFIANHQSNFDIPLLMSQINKPKGFIAKKELESWPGISLWMKYINCVFMDRKNIRKSAEAIVQGINILKSGYSMVIFPEGTRSKGGPTNEFKAGSFKLATKSKVSIVPITIKDSYKLLEETGKIKASDVEIIIHPIIDTKSLSKEELDKLPETVEDIIISAL